MKKIIFTFTIISLFCSKAFTQATGQGPFILTAPAGATNMQWYMNGNPITNATASTYEATAEGVYWVSYDDDTGCSVPADCISVVSPLDDGQQTTLNAPASGSSFVWKKDNTEIGGATTNTLPIDNLSTEVGTYHVEYNNGSCDIVSDSIKLFLLEPVCAAGSTAPPLTLPTNQ